MQSKPAGPPSGTAPGTRIAAALVAALLAVAGPAVADRVDERARMVRTIEWHAARLYPVAGRQAMAARVLEVMATVPRHRFVPELLGELAYRDRPLPIGYGQTISQPFIVAFMTDLLAALADAVVLEIGTGSGYQAAVLAPLVARVCTLEIVPALGRAAAERLARLGYANVQARVGDGYNGWPDCGPFDAIVVTAAASHVPPPLVRQLKPGGRMVIPVGSPFAVQQLVIVDKTAEGKVTTRQVLPVRFVPLTRRAQ